MGINWKKCYLKVKKVSLNKGGIKMKVSLNGIAAIICLISMMVNAIADNLTMVVAVGFIFISNIIIMEK